MKKSLLLCLITFHTATAQEAPPLVIDSVALFKNGLAIVRLSGTLPDAGRLEIDDLVQPVHGTFWIDSEKPVTAKVEMREGAVPLAAVSQAELLQNLSGKKVTLHLPDDTITGEILGDTTEQRREWGRDYGAAENWGRSLWSGNRDGQGVSVGGSMLFVKTEAGGIVAIQPGQVQRIELAEMPEIQRERPVLTLSSAAAGKVSVQYLTKGLSWAPSYHIDLSDAKKLLIKQSGAIRNELTDLKDVEIRLISGFPSVRFGAVDSPLSVSSTWESFFRSLSKGPLFNDVDNGIFQQIDSNRAPEPGAAALGPADEGESVDLHYQSIGRHTLAPGGALSVEVAKAEADYERVVEWDIADTRAPNGRPIEEHERQRSPEKFDGTPWDAIIFRNPFPFPMTTAPAMLVNQGDFRGQQVSTWTNPGAETSIRITMALSITTRSVENEIPESRVNLNIAGNDHYKVQVQGDLTVKNHRAAPAMLVIGRRFSGELLEADREPRSQLLETGIDSINKRNELQWRIELKPGEETAIRYRYEVLVRR